MTVPMNFTTGAGTTVTPDFMNQTTDYPYVDDGQAQVVALPLAGGQISVVIALPHGDLATYEAALAAGDAAVSVPTAYANVQLSLPRFTLAAATFSLRESLEAMGMLQAFGDQAVYMDGLGDADFTGLVPNPAEPDAGQPTGCDLLNLQIADVLQAATIAVQESGVEATAATAVIIGAVASETSTGPPPSVPMVVNHPFLFSIVDATGAVLFVGHVQDPS